MKRIFIALVLVLAVSASAFALSDAEYRRLKRTSSDFRRADNELTQVWKELKESLSSKVFAELQKNQREWIRKGRDDAARKYIREGYSRAEAYTMATNDRAELLPGLAEELNTSKPARPRRQVRQPAPEPKPKPRPAPESEPVPEPKPESESDDDDKGEIEEERFKNQEPGDPEGNYSSKNAFMTVIITDKSSMEASVTISIKSPEEVTWSSESWIDGDTLVLYDKTYSDCYLTLTFEKNRVKIAASESESWKEILGEGVTLSGTYTKN
ncbi:MAG: DUF1311 domain-containing protein [Synergistaceae bacterium]|nr:DUF1311 domain-containing protein [Synergistaceae bacterium]MBQ3449166.1 DUF1311 domain-containing protein [Synergistaceae bacterium]MBQ3694345.1 DUF1311 domain-containing protein [Synergistaceae bacterium]MBQ9627843.1 DUF1311 domain-containing protein [Synergistaceae bacterium]